MKTLQNNKLLERKSALISRKGVGCALVTLAALTAGRAYADVSGVVSGDLQSFGGGIGLGELVYNGSGCPIGSVHLEQDPVTSNLVISFDQFQAVAGGAKKVDQKACALALPIRGIPGYSISALSLRLNGFTELPRTAKGKVTMESFFAGTRGARISKILLGPSASDFSVDNNATATFWSTCGQDVLLRVNMSSVVTVRSARDQATVAIETQDSSSGLALDFRVKKCD